MTCIIGRAYNWLCSFPFLREGFRGFFLRDNTVDEVRGALRVACGGENGMLVILEDFEPPCDVGGVILVKLKGKVGAQEGRSQLGHQFLDSIGLRAESLATVFAAEIPIKPTAGPRMSAGSPGTG